jgi:hypothetical protein
MEGFFFVNGIKDKRSSLFVGNLSDEGKKVL